MEVSINMTDKKIEKGHVNKKKIEKEIVKKKKPFLKIILSIILIPVIGGGIYFVYKGYVAGKEIGFKFSASELIPKKKDPELKKDSTNKYTNVMLVGIDTRANTDLLNTDVIIVGSYNHETKDITMFSIPRDFWARPLSDGKYFTKINAAYSINEGRREGSGLPALESIVEEILGLEIQYHAMINFDGFIELIDSVGGVYVNVENNFTDYDYPEGRYGTQTISFKKGPQLMDGETALKYARSRKSQSSEGSDYARARRQQKVIDAFIEKLMSTETLLNPSKLMSLISSVQNNLKVSEFSPDDIEAGVNILKETREENSTSSTYSFVLDPTIGNYSLIIKDPGIEKYEIYPKEGLGKYTKINQYVDLALLYPALYSENPSIYVYDIGLGYKNSSSKTQELKQNFKYLNIRFQGTKYSDKQGIYIYSNDLENYSKSVDILAKYLSVENKTKPEFITTNTAGDISLLLGKEIVVEDINSEKTE
jgi:LCP family protein required for cell wall assembly